MWWVMSEEAVAGRLAPEQIVAEVTVRDADESGGGRPLVVQLTASRADHGRVLGDGPHVDPVTTALTPSLDRGDADVYWLVGHRPGRRDHAGDTLLRYALVLQVGPGDVTKALWFEDHQEIPTQLWTGAGALQTVGGGGTLSLDLTEVDGGAKCRLEGTIRFAFEPAAAR